MALFRFTNSAERAMSRCFLGTHQSYLIFWLG
jgi:hypothetical protein